MQAGRVAAAQAAMHGTASGESVARGGMAAHVPSERSDTGAARAGGRRSIWSRIFGHG